MTESLTGLALLRKPFPPNQISKLPKPTKEQTAQVKADFKAGIRCDICNSWHHPKVVHLDYVGHAALTDRLLDVDPLWAWEPLAMSPDGLPVMDGMGGMWIRLTVCGVTRLGYGHAGDKTGGDAIKEVIGDALRNAGMRFGAALDLWHKGDLHADNADDPGLPPVDPPGREAMRAAWLESRRDAIFATNNSEELRAVVGRALDACMAEKDPDGAFKIKAWGNEKRDHAKKPPAQPHVGEDPISHEGRYEQ